MSETYTDEADNAKNPTQNLSQNPSQVDVDKFQANIRIRRDLEEYSRNVDPAHVQIEERRRVMHLRLQQRFSQADPDNDGTMSLLEAVEFMPQVARHFNEVDLNGDSLISLDELEALQNRIISRHSNKTANKLDAEAQPSADDAVKTKVKDAQKDTVLSSAKKKTSS